MIVLYTYLSGGLVAGVGGGGRHADRRLLFRDGVGISGGRDRIVQQPHFRADAFDADHRRAADGGAGRLGHERRDRGAGRGGGGLRFERGRRRTAAGFQSRIHYRRHAAQHSDCGTDRGGGGQRGHVFPAAGAAPGQHQHGRHRLRRPSSAGAAGGTDGVARAGHRGRRHGVAADRRGHTDGRRA